MLCEVPLNKEQQAFAADHHGLVYKFLNENRLPEDEFYDVIILAISEQCIAISTSPSFRNTPSPQSAGNQCRGLYLITIDTKLAANAIWRFSVFTSDYIPMVPL